MVVAKKKYYYDPREVHKEIEKKNKNTKKRVNNNSNYKISLIICIILLSALFIFLLTRYTAITEIKYRIHNLNKEISVVEIEIQDLKAELDGFTRSDIIEEKAISELNMQYPQYEQMIFLAINNEIITEQATFDEIDGIKEKENNSSILNNIKTSFEKLYSLLD